MRSSVTRGVRWGYSTMSLSFEIKNSLSKPQLPLHVVKLGLILTIVVTLCCATPAVPMMDPTSVGDELQFYPKKKAYDFGVDSEEIVCLYQPKTRPPPGTVMRLRNAHIQGSLAKIDVDPVLETAIRFQVKKVTSSSKFFCEVYAPSAQNNIAEKQVQVFVLVSRTATCQTVNQCWGYGRNVVCDGTHDGAHRCMCRINAARTSPHSPICTEMITADNCKHILCAEDDGDCECSQEPAIVLGPAVYQTRFSSENYKAKISSDYDEVAILNGSNIPIELRYLERKNEECVRCYRTSANLQGLQVGLFLVGAVLAFIAVVLMAVIIRKMWLYYRIPPGLLEASRDLERETIEREAEQMAQRDKPPSYIEVMEGDLRISGYPPPDYEELASAVRQHRDAERRRSHRRRHDHSVDSRQLRLNTENLGRRHNHSTNPILIGRRLLFAPWHRSVNPNAASGPNQDTVQPTGSSASVWTRPSLPTVTSGVATDVSHLEPPSYEESAQRPRY